MLFIAHEAQRQDLSALVDVICRKLGLRDGKQAGGHDTYDFASRMPIISPIVPTQLTLFGNIGLSIINANGYLHAREFD